MGTYADVYQNYLPHAAWESMDAEEPAVGSVEITGSSRTRITGRLDTGPLRGTFDIPLDTGLAPPPSQEEVETPPTALDCPPNTNFCDALAQSVEIVELLVQRGNLSGACDYDAAEATSDLWLYVDTLGRVDAFVFDDPEVDRCGRAARLAVGLPRFYAPALDDSGNPVPRWVRYILP